MTGIAYPRGMKGLLLGQLLLLMLAGCSAGEPQRVDGSIVGSWMRETSTETRRLTFAPNGEWKRLWTTPTDGATCADGTYTQRGRALTMYSDSGGAPVSIEVEVAFRGRQLVLLPEDEVYDPGKPFTDCD